MRLLSRFFFLCLSYTLSPSLPFHFFLLFFFFLKCETGGFVWLHLEWSCPRTHSICERRWQLAIMVINWRDHNSLKHTAKEDRCAFKISLSNVCRDYKKGKVLQVWKEHGKEVTIVYVSPFFLLVLSLLMTTESRLPTIASVLCTCHVFQHDRQTSSCLCLKTFCRIFCPSKFCVSWNVE